MHKRERDENSVSENLNLLVKKFSRFQKYKRVFDAEIIRSKIKNKPIDIIIVVSKCKDCNKYLTKFEYRMKAFTKFTLSNLDELLSSQKYIMDNVRIDFTHQNKLKVFNFNFIIPSILPFVICFHICYIENHGVSSGKYV